MLVFSRTYCRGGDRVVRAHEGVSGSNGFPGRIIARDESAATDVMRKNMWQNGRAMAEAKEK